jgi:hypothetical protein
MLVSVGVCIVKSVFFSFDIILDSEAKSACAVGLCLKCRLLA